MKLVPCLTFKTGILSLKSGSPYFYRVLATINKSTKADTYVGVINIMSDKGIILLEKSFSFTNATLDAAKEILYKHINIYESGYSKAMILFSGEEYEFVEYSKMLCAWNEETEKLLEIIT